MDQEERLEVTPPSTIISRFDRLDRLLQFLEEKHCLSGRHSSSPVVRKMEPEDQCKSMSSALEEVQDKGTLMERVAMLENRVSQLSLEMDVGNTSRSSSSSIPVPGRTGKASALSRVDRQDEDVMIVHQDNKQADPLIIQEGFAEVCVREAKGCQKGRRQKKTVSTMRYRKWLGWFQMRC